MINYFSIAVIGNIGAGKTTFCNKFSEKSGWPVFYENINDNPYLSLFYKNEIDAFKCQIAFMSRFLENHLSIQKLQKSVIIDRILSESVEVFEYIMWKSGKINDIDHQEFIRLYNIVSKMIRPIDLHIYLQSSPERCIKNISKRSRECESNIDHNYICNLHQRYEEWIKTINGTVYIVNTDKNENFDEIYPKIIEYLLKFSG